MLTLEIFGDIFGSRDNYTGSGRVREERVKWDGRELISLLLCVGYRGAAPPFYKLPAQ
jgi:hypothetical protein